MLGAREGQQRIRRLRVVAAAPVYVVALPVAHVADTQTEICATLKGELKKGNAAGKTSKDDLIAALKASFAYCDPVYDALTDANGAKLIDLYGHKRSRLGALYFNVEHDNAIAVVAQAVRNRPSDILCASRYNCASF